MNLPFNKAIYNQREINAVLRVFKTDYLSCGEQTALFENELAKWWGMKYAVSANSGSSANFIALQSLELPKGSEVITPAGGAFPTTISPIIYHGLIPVFVDVDLDNFCMDLKPEAISEKTRAIIFAHTLGKMPEMDRVMSIAKKHNLKVIEDCADAMGSKQNGKMAGSFGNLATVSFYPAHLMTAGGEGGAILTNNYHLYRKCLSIRDWGRACFCRPFKPIPACGDRFSNPKFDHRYYYINLGLNFKLTEMQAAFGREQLKRVHGFILKRKCNYRILQKALRFPKLSFEINPFAFAFLTNHKQEVMIHLAKAGIGTRTIFSGNILRHPAYKSIKCRKVDLKNSERVFNESVFVGVGPHLTIKNMKYIAKTLKEVL